MDRISELFVTLEIDEFRSFGHCFTDCTLVHRADGGVWPTSLRAVQLRSTTRLVTVKELAWLTWHVHGPANCVDLVNSSVFLPLLFKCIAGEDAGQADKLETATL